MGGSGGQRGIVLVTIVLILSLLLGAVTGVVLSTRTDLRTAGNLKRRAKAFYIAQAGLEHAWQELMDGDGWNDFKAVFANQETSVLFRKEPFSAGSYTVTAEPLPGTTPNRIRLIASGCLPAAEPCPAGHSLSVIEGQFIATPIFSHALLAREQVALSRGALTDSFDSRLGPYTPSGAGSHGDVASDGEIQLAGARTEVRGNARAGSRILQRGSRVTGDIVTGAPAVGIPSLYSPCGASFSKGSGISGGQYDRSSGVLMGIGSAPVTFAEGSYCLKEIDLRNGGRLFVKGGVTLHLLGQGRFGGGINNLTQVPGNLKVFSAFSSKGYGITLSGGAGVSLAIYAAHTGVRFQGQKDFFGAVVAARIDNEEGTRIHFDQALEANDSVFVKRVAWRELF